jgi:hypothetical protein
LRALLADAASLAREMSPPRDLWPGIATRLAAAKQEAVLGWTVRPRWGVRLSLAVTAVVLIGVTAVLVYRPERSATVTTPSETLTAVDLAFNNDDAMTVAARSYAVATAELMAAWDSRRSAFLPETQAVIDENLRIIDDSLRKLHEAIQKDPFRSELKRLLVAVHQKKVDTLQMLLRVDAPRSSAGRSDDKRWFFHEEEKS